MLFVLVIVSHVRDVVISSGVALLLLWPLYTGYSLCALSRDKLLRKRILFSYLVSWLILVWIVYKAVKAVI